METRYTHVNKNEAYKIFRDSAFAHAIRNRIASLQADPSWSLHFHPLPANPDAVTIACRDQEERLVPGTPSPGEYILTRGAHEDYDGDPGDSTVAGELDRLEEFLVRVKDAFRSKK